MLKAAHRAAFFHPRMAWIDSAPTTVDPRHAWMAASTPWRTEVTQRRASQQMHVDMEHGLPGIFAAVHHDAVAVLRESFPTRVLGGGQGQLADQVRLRRLQVIQGRNDLVLRNEQHVHRRLRCDVLERQHVVVFIDDGGRDLATDDLAEEGFAAHGRPRRSIFRIVGR